MQSGAVGVWASSPVGHSTCTYWGGEVQDELPGPTLCAQQGTGEAEDIWDAHVTLGPWPLSQSMFLVP